MMKISAVGGRYLEMFVGGRSLQRNVCRVFVLLLVSFAPENNAAKVILTSDTEEMRDLILWYWLFLSDIDIELCPLGPPKPQVLP